MAGPSDSGYPTSTVTRATVIQNPAADFLRTEVMRLFKCGKKKQQVKCVSPVVAGNRRPPEKSPCNRILQVNRTVDKRCIDARNRSREMWRHSFTIQKPAR